eukprot:scaffold7537_cov179-Ochromonas_danica.AAC.10
MDEDEKVVSTAFLNGQTKRSGFIFKGLSMSTTTAQAEELDIIPGPDFYWQYRLNRLVEKKGKELPFSAANYPELKEYRDLYYTYYLDLTLQGKLGEDFDWVAEREVNDEEWLKIFENISKWTAEVSKTNKRDAKSLPVNDFELLQKYYPKANLRDLTVPFTEEEKGGLPYNNLKELFGAALDGTLNVPGYSKENVSLDATDARKQLDELKEQAFKELDATYQKLLARANDPFPDEQSKKHYQALRTKLESFPQTPAEWEAYRVAQEKEIDEMARLASKKATHHHGHHDADHHQLTPEEEFEAKYGRNLAKMKERMSKFKADPKGFFDASVVEKFGKNGLDIWKQTQELSAKLEVMSEAEKSATEKEFRDFIKKA